MTVIEAVGDLWTWEPPCPHTEHTVDVCVATRRVDARCITTNGVVTNAGTNVMGRGVAQQARDMYPGIDHVLGRMIDHRGNRPARLVEDRGTWIVSYPVKHHWRARADLALIRESAGNLIGLADMHAWTKIVLPRPGCGAGGLAWASVRPVIEPILDDRFVVVTRDDL